MGFREISISFIIIKLTWNNYEKKYIIRQI